MGGGAPSWRASGSRSGSPSRSRTTSSTAPATSTRPARLRSRPSRRDADPAVILAARADEGVRRALARAKDGALERVSGTGAIETARGYALEYAARARAALDGEPDRASLEALPISWWIETDRWPSSRSNPLSTPSGRRWRPTSASTSRTGSSSAESDDLLQLGELADTARRVRGGTDEVYFVQNLYLNQTNCRVKCKFCAFAVTQKQDGAYTITPTGLVEDALRQRERTGFTEIHMVNGENPHVGFDFYVDTIRLLRGDAGRASEVLYGERDPPHDEDRAFARAGAGRAQGRRSRSLPGGGAEVFADRVRRLIAPGKEHPDFWFHTHRTAHGLGIPTHCTMLYGHVETYEERVDHLLRLRALQDETGGFLAFIPLAFHPENTVFERRG